MCSGVFNQITLNAMFEKKIYFTQAVCMTMHEIRFPQINMIKFVLLF